MGDYILKKRLKVLLLGCFAVVFSVFSLCSCSLVSTDEAKKNSVNSMKVGEKVLTKNDVISQFYTYYQNNSNYFSYYDSDTIVNSFYTWVAMRQIISENSEKMLYDETKNPTGYVVYTKKDEEEVWKSVKDYFYTQVNNYEKAYYSLKGYEEDSYPVWLKDEEDDTPTGFQSYKSTKPEITSRSEKIADWTVKMGDAKIKAELEHVQDYLFTFVTETDSEGNETRSPITYEGYIDGSRNEAYTRYVEWLVSSAKSSGNSTDVKTVLENEVLRVYNSYYESKITALFQNFYLQEYLTNYFGVEVGSPDDGKLGDTVSLSDKAIVKAFFDKYYSDMQANQVESSFISTITSSDGASLVLYNYNGQNFFFSVQHILIKFDDYISGKISELEGYASGSGTDYDAVISEYFKNARKELVEKYKNGMLAAVNKDNYLAQTSIAEFVDGVVKPYYFDETKNDENGNGYIKLEVEFKEDKTSVENIFDYENVEYYYMDGSDKKVVDPADIKWYANKDDIDSIYQSAYTTLVKDFLDYYDALASNNESTLTSIRDMYKSDMSYILETVENIQKTYSDVNQAKALIRQKISSFAFVELEFIFSADSLANELSNKIGYVMSNYPDENGSWVVDFAEGAREIVKNLVSANDIKDADKVNKAIADKLSLGDINGITNTIISDYGYHIIKIEDIYTPGASLVDLTGIDTKQELTDEYAKQIADILRKTYVCSASNQTVYDYFYDQIYKALAGDASTSGTYFLKLEYEWLHEYYNAGKIVFENKLSYQELIDGIS